INDAGIAQSDAVEIEVLEVIDLPEHAHFVRIFGEAEGSDEVRGEVSFISNRAAGSGRNVVVGRTCTGNCSNGTRRLAITCSDDQVTAISLQHEPIETLSLSLSNNCIDQTCRVANTKR